MPKTTFISVADYIAAQPKATQAVLRLVRKIIRKAVPGAEEGISYQMPAFKLHGSPLLYFAGWKDHYALYPGSGSFIASLGEELASCEVSKGTIRFPMSQPVPVKLIGRIAKLRAKEVTGKKTKVKATSSSKKNTKPTARE